MKRTLMSKIFIAVLTISVFAYMSPALIDDSWARGGSSSFSSGGSSRSSSSSFSSGSSSRSSSSGGWSSGSSSKSSTPSSSSSSSNSRGGSSSFSSSSGSKSSSGWSSSGTSSAPTTQKYDSSTKTWTSSGGTSAPASSSESSRGGSSIFTSSKPEITKAEKPSWSSGSNANSGITMNIPSNERQSISDKYRAPQYHRPSDWTPSYSNSSNDFFDLYWKLSLLNAMTGHDRVVYANEMRQDPNYAKWRAEADKLAAENKDLKEQLNKADWTPAEDKENESSFLSVFFTTLIIFIVVGTIGLVAYHIFFKRRRRY